MSDTVYVFNNTESRKRIFYKPGWERQAIALAHARTHNSKTKRVVCGMSKTFYGVLPHLFLIHNFPNYLLHFLLLPSLNTLSACIQQFIYFSFFI